MNQSFHSPLQPAVPMHQWRIWSRSGGVIAWLLLAAIGCSAEPQRHGALPIATLLTPKPAQPKDRRVVNRNTSHDHAAHHQDSKPTMVLPPAVDLVISEVMSDPLLIADVVGEYVELVYLGSEPASVAGLTLLLPDGRRLPVRAGGSRATEAEGRRAAAPAEVKRGQVVRPGDVIVVRSSRSSKLRLPNRAGRVELWRGVDRIDVATWTGRWPWPKHRAGQALCRRSPDRSGAHGRAWRRCRSALRAVERGSPGTVHSKCEWLATRQVAVPSCDRQSHQRGRRHAGG